MEDFEGDAVCKIMEMLNFSVISNDKLKELSIEDESTQYKEHPNKGNDVNNGTSFHDNGKSQHELSQCHVVSARGSSEIEIVKESELAYQCMMLGTDLFLAREENMTISKRLIEVIKENEALKEDLCKAKEEREKLSNRLKDASRDNEILGKELGKVKEEKAKLSKKLSEESPGSVENQKLKYETKRKLIQVEKMLSKLEHFSTDFQCEVKTFLKVLAKVVEKDSRTLGLEDESIGNFLKLLIEIIGKVPVYVLKDWDETKQAFRKLNELILPETLSTTGSLPKSPEEEVTPTTPMEVTTTTASPPTREEAERDNGISTAVDNDEDILILEENISLSRPPVVITRTTVPKTPANAVAASSANNPNTCVFCGAKYTDSELLIEHLAIVHKGCHLCKISFADQEMLNRHIQFTHHYWHPESQPVPTNAPVSNSPTPTTPSSLNEDSMPPPPPPNEETSKTQSQTINIGLPLLPNLSPRSRRPKHGMVSSDPKDVWNKCFCGYAFMSKKELSVHILSNKE